MDGNTERTWRFGLQCREHGFDLIPMYCKECESPLCYDCLTTNHVKHELGKVSEIADEYKLSLQDCFNGKNSKFMELNELYSQVDGKGKKLMEYKEKIQAEIASREEFLFDEVRRARKKEEEKVERLFDSAQKPVTSDKNDIEHILSVGKEFDLQLQSEKDQIFCVVLNAELNRLLAKIPHYVAADDSNISFHIPDSRETCPVQFGNVLHENDILSDSIQEHPAIDEDRATCPEIVYKHDKQGVSKEHLCIKFPEALGKNITKVVIVNENAVYVLFNTSEVYYCNLNGKQTYIEKIDENVCDFIVPRPGEVLVYKPRKEWSRLYPCFTTGGQVQRIKDKTVKTFIKLTSQEKIAFMNKGYNSYVAFITDTRYHNLNQIESHDIKLYEMNDSGIVVSATTFPSDFTGLGLEISFKFVSENVIVCRHRDYMLQYVSSFSRRPESKGALLEDNFTQEFIYTGSIGFDPPKRFNPTDICVDSEQNILIVASNDDAIHLLDKSGKLIKILMTEEDGLKEPLSVDLHQNGNMCIGCTDGTLHLVKYQNYRKAAEPQQDKTE